MPEFDAYTPEAQAALADITSDLDGDRLNLFKAYIAGWERSAEGWNGEYTRGGPSDTYGSLRRFFEEDCAP